jgi:NAD+ synthase (glutamine-hydrolysing)
MKPMNKIALAQINPTVGDLRENSSKIIAAIKKAKASGADIVIFPELALVGYPPEDLLLKPHFVAQNKRYLARIAKASSGIIALVGFIDRKNEKLYNACAVIQDKKVRDVYRKIVLPNYGVFDEKRYFTPGDTLGVYDCKDFVFSLTICEDVWNPNLITALKGKKLDFLVNISASPFHLGKDLQRERILAGAARSMHASVLYCNLVGGQDEIVFDGASRVFSPQGKILACARKFSEDFLVFSPQKAVRGRRLGKPGPKEKDEAFSALRLGIYDYVRKNGFKKVILGISGGIDSAVVASLASLALGANNVYALIMPSRYTSKHTLRDAQTICRNLGIPYSIIDISSIVEIYLNALGRDLGGAKGDKTEENLQARIRGNILMAFSNTFGYLVLNTGNKSEMSCGYCTLYGDMVGGFGVLKDVYKLRVYKLASYINKIMGKTVIPASVFKRPPSAELKANQKDSDTLPPYELLDPILKLYVEDNYSLDKIVKAGFDRKVVRKVIAMVDSNEYKRRQAAVGIKITPRAFGKDRRMPITNKFSQ